MDHVIMDQLIRARTPLAMVMEGKRHLAQINPRRFKSKLLGDSGRKNISFQRTSTERILCGVARGYYMEKA